MTVQELIDELNKVRDKSFRVLIDLDDEYCHPQDIKYIVDGEEHGPNITEYYNHTVIIRNW